MKNFYKRGFVAQGGERVKNMRQSLYDEKKKGDPTI